MAIALSTNLGDAFCIRQLTNLVIFPAMRGFFHEDNGFSIFNGIALLIHHPDGESCFGAFGYSPGKFFPGWTVRKNIGAYWLAIVDFNSLRMPFLFIFDLTEECKGKD
ncbi:MAG: hypothetical protein GX561_14580 [Lentisphaerae bacterium]|nr:hypothetical protein [Lentisphaerota bacterium]